MGNVITVNFSENESQNKLDLTETRQGKMAGFCKHDYEQIIKVLLPTDAQENCFKRSIKIYIKTASD